MRRDRWLLWGGLALLAFSAGCGRYGYNPLQAGEGGTLRPPGSDAAVSSDGGAGPDGGQAADAGPLDAGGIVDAADAGAVGDAGGGVDAGVDADGGPGGPTAPIAVDVASFATASASFVDVPGGTLQVVADAQQSWLVLISSRLCSSIGDSPSAEARFLVDGTQRGFGGIATDVAARCGPFQQMVVLERNSGMRTVQMQIRQVGGGTGTIEDLHLVAIPLPVAADLRTSENLAVQTLSSTAFSDFHSFTFTPAAAGEYLAVMAMSVIEDTGTTVYARFADTGAGTVWPTNFEFGVARAGWQSMFAAERRTFAQTPQTLALRARLGTATTTGRVQSARIVVFRTDALAHFESTTTPTFTASGAANALVAQRASSPPGGLLGQVILQSQVSAVVCGFDGVHTPSFVVDGSTESIPHSLNCGQRSSYGRVSFVGSDQPVSIQNRVTAEQAGNEVLGRDSTIHVLGF